MWICRSCQKALEPNAGAVVKHYQKYHLLDYNANRDKIAKYPKAFVNTSDTSSPTHRSTGTSRKSTYVVKNVNPDAARKREANLKTIAAKLDDYNIVFTYRESKYLTCECCGQQYAKGKRLKMIRNVYFDLCYDCYRLAREQYRRDNPPKIKIEYYPENGLNKYHK